MDAVTEKSTVDQVVHSLGVAGETLDEAVQAATTLSIELRAAIVRIRPLGLLTGDEMAEALGRPRNYVDGVWSMYGNPGKGAPLAVATDADPVAARQAFDELLDLSSRLNAANTYVKDCRAHRNEVVATVYRTKVLGPSAIANAAGIDRNHVLRIARAAGVPPVHRADVRNQYSK